MSVPKEIRQLWDDLAAKGEATWDERIAVMRRIVEEAKKRGSDAVYLPVEEEARRAAREYAAQPKPSRDLESQMMGVIVKYLLLNYVNLDACTEFEMEKRLGVPRHKLRRLLGFLEWGEVVTAFEVGSTKPYVVTDLSKAFREGYLRFSQEEAVDLAKVIPWLDKPSITGLGMAVEYHNPKDEFFIMLNESIPNWETPWKISEFLWKRLLEQGRFFMYIPPFKEPLFPNEIKTKGPDPWWVEDSGFSHDWALVQAALNWFPYGRELLFELGVPSDVTADELERAFRRLVEKYVKAVDAFYKPLSRMLKEHSISETAQKVTKLKELVHSAVGESETIVRGGMSAEGVKEVVMDITKDYQFVGNWSCPLSGDHVAFVLSILRAARRTGEFASVTPDILESIDEQIGTLGSRLAQ